MSYACKNIWSLVEVYHGEEHFVGMMLRVTEGIGHNHKFVMSMPEK